MGIYKSGDKKIFDHNDETVLISNGAGEQNTHSDYVPESHFFNSKQERPLLRFLHSSKHKGMQQDTLVHIKRKRIAFYSPIPGSGAKETAINTAVMLAQYGEGDVCVVDCDFYNPSLDFLFGINPYIKENSSYLDKNVVYSSLYCLLEDAGAGKDRDVLSYLIQHDKYKSLFVATGIYGCDQLDDRGVGVLMDFVDRCYNEFDYVILICSGYAGVKSLSGMFKGCDVVYAVMEANAYQLDRVSRHINLLNDLYYMDDTRFRIVVNKFDASRNIDVKQIYRQYGYKVSAVVSFDALHVVCRSTRRFFVEECGSERLREYLRLIEDIGYKPNEKALKR